jgi:hypothetical protein
VKAPNAELLIENAEFRHDPIRSSRELNGIGNIIREITPADAGYVATQETGAVDTSNVRLSCCSAKPLILPNL